MAWRLREVFQADTYMDGVVVCCHDFGQIQWLRYTYANGAERIWPRSEYMRDD